MGGVSVVARVRLVAMVASLMPQHSRSGVAERVPQRARGRHTPGPSRTADGDDVHFVIEAKGAVHLDVT